MQSKIYNFAGRANIYFLFTTSVPPCVCTHYLMSIVTWIARLFARAPPWFYFAPSTILKIKRTTDILEAYIY